jgi:hypothetical protein
MTRPQFIHKNISLMKTWLSSINTPDWRKYFIWAVGNQKPLRGDTEAAERLQL